MQRSVSAGRARDGGHRPNRAVAPATGSAAAAVVSHRRRCAPNSAPGPVRTDRTEVVRQALLPKLPLSNRVSWAPRESLHLLTLYAGTVWPREGPGGIARPSRVIHPANRACRGFTHSLFKPLSRVARPDVFLQRHHRDPALR